MKVYVQKHEAYIKESMKQNKVDGNLIFFHEKRIEWLAHERLAHLIVFLFTLASLMTFFILAFISEEIWFYVIAMILLIVSTFYCVHYFFLENAIQRWYKMADEMRGLLKK